MLFYRAALSLSGKTLNYVAGVIRRHLKATGLGGGSRTRARKPCWCWPVCGKARPSRNWRPGSAGRTTAWRYVDEVVALLAARAPKLHAAVREAKRAGHAYVILDGTLIPTGRVARDRPFYSGKHKKHGMNLQVIASPDGDILWVSGALPGSVHDKKAEWIWGVLDELELQGLVTLADKGYQGSDWAKVPYKGKNKPEPQKEVNRAHAKLRAPGERANAQLKTWRILRKLRCCPWRAGKLAKAIHVLQLREA
jgi:DDE superfamily endonuclease